MRQKAEKEIRKAAGSLGEMKRYRIDNVRDRTPLIRKVFDKTILDMARVGTVELFSKDASEVDDFEIRGLIRQGETVHVSFAFTDTEKEKGDEAEGPTSEKMNIILRGVVSQGEWEMFECLCQSREKKKGLEKIREIILEYNQHED